MFEISNVHNERNINLKFVILVRIHLNGFSGDCKSKKWENKVFIIFKCNWVAKFGLIWKWQKSFVHYERSKFQAPAFYYKFSSVLN